MTAPPSGAGRRAQDLTPRAIVEELDRYIVGQKAAKRAAVDRCQRRAHDPISSNASCPFV